MRLSISPHPCGGDDGGVDAAVPPVLLLVAALPLVLLLLLLMLPLCDVDSIVLGMVASNQINSIQFSSIVVSLSLCACACV